MSPEQFLELAEHLPDAMLLVRTDGTIVAANGQCYSQFGLRPSDLTGQSLYACSNGERAELQSYLRHCARSGDGVPGVLRLRDCSGGEVACRAHGVGLRSNGSAQRDLLFLRLTPKQSAVGQFLALNEKLEELEREIRRRRQVEQNLREERERLRITLASIGDAVVVTDGEGCVTLLNAVAEQLTGWTTAEAAGMPFEDIFRIVSETTRGRVTNPARQALATGEVVGLANHTVLLSRDGREVPIDDKAAPIKDAQGVVLGVVVIFRDITDRREAERAVRSSEARKSAILRTSLDSIVTLDASGRIQEVNPAAERLFGYPDTLLLRKSIQDLMRASEEDESGAEAWQQFSSAARSTSGRRVELAALRADGQRIPVEVAVTQLEPAERPTLTCFIRDIRDRRRWQAEITEQLRAAAFGRDVGLALSHTSTLRRMLQLVSESMVRHLDAAFARVWVLSDDKKTLELTASAGLYTHLDGPHSRIPLGSYKIGKIAHDQEPHLTNCVVGDPRVHDQEWAQREAMQAFAGYPLVVDGRTIGVMAMFCRQELSERALEALSSVANAVALGIERKRINAALRQHTRALQAADRRKDEFLAMLAHELRNPLAPLRLGLDLLAMEGGESETTQLMKQQVEHLIRLVDDLLDVSRIMRGKITLRRQNVALEQLLSRAVATARPTIDAHGHELNVSQPETATNLNCDPVRLAQVVSNLLNNAAKYTPPQGKIDLQAESHEKNLVLRVRDNGLGIEPEFLPEIFELFSQSDRSLERAEGGLGIGLTLVHRLVQLHGGHVTAESEGLGKGSTFTVTLPIVTGEVPKRTAAKPTARSSAQACRILVVDDNHSAAKMLQLLFTQLGHRDVHVAHDGQSALEAARSSAHDLLLLDIGLPGLNGYQLAEKLRADPQYSKSLFVALTGYGQDEDRRRSLEAGFDEHLVKPPSLEMLQALLLHPKLTNRRSRADA